MTVETSVEWIHSILVPLDGTSESASALPVGRTMAKIAGATLRIIHATERASPLTELRRKLTLSSGDMADAVLEQSSENPVEAVAGAVSAHPGTLIVMSTHGAGRPEGGLGSVASGLLQSTDSPLLLVHPSEELERWHLGRVLLTQDGTPEAASAFVPAVQLARGAKASLTVLHVGGRTERSQVEEGTLTPPRYVDQPQHEWPEWTQELLDRIRCLCWVPEEVHVRIRLAKGDPVREILRFAMMEVADLIVLPCPENLKSDPKAIARVVLRDSPFPVLILPDRREMPPPRHL